MQETCDVFATVYHWLNCLAINARHPFIPPNECDQVANSSPIHK